MYLEKLVIQGFKSFANKNTLVFPGMLEKGKRGLTAVVGPNGSGKSNIADSVRWALGEQSMKTLRGKKSEDIIFSGSDKKGKLGMAEVSLHLNNEENSETQNKIDFSEIVLTRRLYRDGESEYLINNSRVRLSDVQMLLAKANFGQKTYSVIGQGMVEGFLNTSLAERKEFFDEATGVKQYQIKRDDALNKLGNSHENYGQVNMLLSEIEPRLKSLTRQVAKLERREAIEKELKELQIEYYGRSWKEMNSRFNECNGNFLALEKEKNEKERKLQRLNDDFEKISLAGKENKELEELRMKLNSCQRDKDLIVKQIARADAEMEIKLESRGQFDLSWLKSKRDQLNETRKKVKEEIEIISKRLESEEEIMEDLNKEGKELENRLKELNENLSALKRKSKNLNGAELSEELKKVLQNIADIESEDDILKVRKILKDIRLKFKETIEKLNGGFDEDEIAKIEKELSELAELKDSLNSRINSSNFNVSTQSEKKKLLISEDRRLGAEYSDICAKLQKNTGDFNFQAIEDEKKSLNEKLEKIELEFKVINEKISSFSAQEDEEKSRMLTMQKSISALQFEINSITGRMNEAKINSTRYETRLEDLEAEIRANLGSLKEVKDYEPCSEFNEKETPEKIRNLKHQLELIGGIDPETAKEYSETKERFDFLSTQVGDLSQAVESLEKVIKELDEKIKEQFDKEFKIIASKFEEYFKILFNGGSARIIKVIEEENVSEGPAAENLITEGQPAADRKIKFLKKHNATGLAGIEIQATPPGKKIRSVSMLSGGERALTAIALICAIISANPSPFVVLDEVDAALDEANSERLAKILDDLSHKTQFIVITHNRSSMRRASILYGVTMEESGVSKLLSIKLEGKI